MYKIVMSCPLLLVHGFCLFFFNDTATPEIYTLSLHDALPIYPMNVSRPRKTTTAPARIAISFTIIKLPICCGSMYQNKREFY